MAISPAIPVVVRKMTTWQESGTMQIREALLLDEKGLSADEARFRSWTREQCDYYERKKTLECLVHFCRVHFILQSSSS